MSEVDDALRAASRIERPWLAPIADAARCVARTDPDLALHERLGVAAASPRFVAQDDLPPDEAYEAFIARSGCVPTRDNVHDLFNGLMWLSFPSLKKRLNLLQAAQIGRDGVGSTRGAVRDTLTLFDENAALWAPPPVLADALRRRDWRSLFVLHREDWNEAPPPLLFGHALLEKLQHPRPAITTHVWLAPFGEDPVAWWTETLDAASAAARPWHPLQVLGVPGWWAANEDPDFYADATVFRPPPLG